MRKKILQKIGKEIRRRRIKLNMSQEGLAFESGLHRTYIGAVERGERNISLLNIYKLAIALNCKASDLLL